MTERLWEMPAPSTAVLEGGPVFEKRPRREGAITFSYRVGEVAQNCTELIFEGVEAFKVTYYQARSVLMLEAYGCLIDCGSTPWLSEITENLKRNESSTEALVHLMINFDDDPCYEVICRAYRIKSQERSGAKPDQDLSSVVSQLESARVCLKLAEHYQLALENEVGDLNSDDAVQLDDLLLRASHEIDTQLGFTLQDIERFRKRIALRREFDELSDQQFEEVINSDCSTPFVLKLSRELELQGAGSVDVKELRHRLRYLANEWAKLRCP